ncbi:Glycosyl transferases group 1 [Microbacterium azadirachtae]|uniref:Glycosyl transferases group 1 n=1 Tax=Microbacterium azadirachtae TaxID=582680 RepID=A0A0F0KZK9_9MICO|nr:glycosyltransferase [Microbacterium azadirachtae]KJL26327.1 Glycosyl transferases group 1 [Microbacterium azadirachtae]
MSEAAGRLLLLTHQYPYDAGDAAFVRNEIEALASAFDKVLVVSLTAPAVARLALPRNVRYLGAVGTITPARAARGLRHPRRAARALRVFLGEGARSLTQMRSDVIASLCGAWFASHPAINQALASAQPLTVYSFWGVDIAYVLPWLRPRARRIAVRVHRYDLDERTAGYRPLRRAVLGAADVVLTIAESGRDYLRDRAPYIAPGRIVIRRLGIPSQPEVEPRTQPADAIQLVSCSSVIALKRVDRILDTAAELARAGERVSWTHFGDGPLFEALRAKAVALTSEIPSLSVELRGRVPAAQVLEHHRVNHPAVFINLSTIEGIPVSAMEAACFGIPIVATDVGSTYELVGEALGSGILVNPDDDIETVVSAVRTILAEPTRFDSKRVWAERFDAAINSTAAATSVKG